MQYQIPEIHINPHDYEYIVSLGNKCPTAGTLHYLKLYKESFPFDWIPTTPKLIRKYLENTSDYFPNKNEIRTKDKVWFGHFDLDSEYEKTIDTFKRRFERLFDILKNKKKILFVYADNAGIYNELNIQQNDSYADICSISDYIKTKFCYTNFTIMAIHINKIYPNGNNIINYNLEIPEEFISNNWQTHDKTTVPYNKIITEFMKDIFKI